MKTQHRYFESDFQKTDEDDRVLEFTFSTDNEINRGFYYETLSHDSKAVDLRRLRSGGPVLFNHHPDRQIGVVLDAQIRGNKGIVKCKFSKAQEADEIYQDILAGIRRGVSVGYLVDDVEQIGEVSGLPRILVNRWNPLEISIVSIPADLGCGFSRDIESCKEIFALGAITKKGKEAYFAVRDGLSINQFKESIQKKDEQEVQPVSRIDVSYADKQTCKPSIVKLLRGVADNDWGNSQVEKEFLLNMDKVREKTSNPMQIEVPNMFLRTEKEPKNFGNKTEGIISGWTDAAFIAKDPTGIIDLIQDKSVLGKLNTKKMSGLTEPIEFLHVKKQSFPEPEDEAFWVGDNTNVKPSNAEFYRVFFDKTTLGTYVDFPRSLLLQDTYGVQEYLKNMIVEKLAKECERAFFYGKGTSYVPCGIYQYLLRNSFSERYDMKGVKYADPCNRILYALEEGLNWPTIVSMETEIAIKNADTESMAYVTNPYIRGLLKSREKSANTNTYLWSDGLNGYKAHASNLIGKISQTKHENHIFLGDWSQCIIGEWSGVKMLVDPFTLSLQGALRIKVEKTINFFTHAPESFVMLKLFKKQAELEAAKKADEEAYKKQAQAKEDAQKTT